MQKFSFIWALLLACSLGFVTGCRSTKGLDNKVHRTLGEKLDETGGVTDESLVDAQAQLGADIPESIDGQLDAARALNYAVSYSRDLQNRRDTLYRNAVSLLHSRRNLGLEWSGDFNYNIRELRNGDSNEDAGLNFSVSDTLWTGAGLLFKASSIADLEAAEDEDEGSVEEYVNTLSVRIEQPLLAGAGYTSSHESLIQAERDLVYMLRDFAQQRQDFAIGIYEGFYGLITQRSVMRNTGLNVQQSAYLRERSEALFKVQLAPYIDVLRSQQQELSAQNRLTNVENQYLTAVKRYLNELGLPIEIKLDFDDAPPELLPLAVDEAYCVEVGMSNRFDLISARQALEDAQRRLGIARQNFLPEINLFGEASFEDDAADSPIDSDFEEELVAGISVELPIDRRSDREAIKIAELAVAEAERNLVGRSARVQIEIADSFNELKTLERNVIIERQNTGIAEKRAENAQFRFKRGELSNRDVVEAENELLDARNAYVRALVDHELERFRILRNMGLLDLTGEGELVEVRAGVRLERSLFMEKDAPKDEES